MPDAQDIHELARKNAEGVALFEAGSAKAAVSVFAKALDGCRFTLGDDHPATLTVAGNLAVAQVSAGRRRDGLDALLANVADRARALGDDDPRTLTALDALAVAYRLAGRVDDAVELSQQVTAHRLRTLGATHLDTLTSRMGLTLAQAAAGDISSAASVLASALADAERAYGEKHPHTVALVECGRSIGLVPSA